jgi:hypothetical protein
MASPDGADGSPEYDKAFAIAFGVLRQAPPDASPFFATTPPSFATTFAKLRHHIRQRSPSTSPRSP